MSNRKFKKTRPGRRGVTPANTYHLSRILLFLRENKGYHLRKTLINNCCMNGYQVKNALQFLVKEGFVEEVKDNHLLFLYSIKERKIRRGKIRRDKERVKKAQRKYYLKNREKILKERKLSSKKKKK